MDVNGNHQETSLAVRGNKRPSGFDLPAGKVLLTGAVFGLSSLDNLLRSRSRELACNSRTCTTCVDDDGDPCCGCVCMDLKWAFDDIDECEGCNYRDRRWPYGTPVSLPRSPLESSDSPATDIPNIWDGQEDDIPDLGTGGMLQKLQPGEVGISPKRVKACGRAFSLVGDYRYPAFPANHSFPWDGIQNGKYDSISRYWGNSSADCANWSVAKFQQHDLKQITTGPVRADYQSKSLI